ncbi:hypothetical protein MM213_08350 [Belliella sp. R4-6]|uniref:Outer membrane protein beta-barrel domain-containing protein n=1 Tax=Belliella alkalica TaxID=1730871 RepID=A0ABS9VAN4_9BACT|nr:hypothetical protein [Belliella alkalica]MCH7413491.1 hypothetical protein [Belliella alkalica]
MNKKLIVFLFLVFVITLQINAQSKFSIGLQGGRSVLIPETLNVPNQLVGFDARGAGGVNFILYGRYFIRPSWSVRLGTGILGYKSAHEFNSDLRTTGFSGVQPQAMSSLDYHVDFGNSGFGLILSAGINSNLAHQYSDIHVLDADGIFLAGYISRNENGDLIDSYLRGHEVAYSFSDQKILLHLRPEISVFKKFGRHKFLAAFSYSHALSDPISKIEYTSISFENEYFAARHRFGGSYTTLQAGYEFGF